MSVSSVSLNTDVTVRYERLAAEYSKLRAQAKVLRDGVLSERSKAEKLAEELKTKDTALRKLLTENESLQFRNDQLVRRVENLQDEIERTKKVDHGKPDKKKSLKEVQKPDSAKIGGLELKIRLLEDELKDKLGQNEKFVSQITESDRLHGEEMAQLSEKFSREYRLLEEELDEIRRKFIRNSASVSSTQKGPIKTVPKEQSSIEFDGSLIADSPPPPPPAKEEALVQGAESVLHTLQGFSSLFTLLQQRAEAYPYDLTMESVPEHVQQLATEFGNCSLLLEHPIDSVTSCLERAQFEYVNDIIPLCNSTKSLVSSEKLPQLIRRMCDEESKVTWSSRQLEKMNEDWANSLIKLFKLFEKIGTNIDEDEEQETGSLVSTLAELADNCRDLDGVFRARWLHESRFPTATKRLRCIGTALSDCLQKLAAETAKLAARANAIQLLSDSPPQAETVVGVVEESSCGKNPFEDDEISMNGNESGEEEKVEIDKDLPTTCSRCSQKLGRIFEENLEEDVEEKKEEIEEVPKVTSVEMEYLRGRVNDLEGERDKLLVDFALVKRKLEIANGKQVTLSDVDHLREIGRERTKELLQRAQVAECTSKYYEQECANLVRLTLFAEREKEELEEKLSKLEKQRFAVEDELTSVRRSYEAQLAQLSEHVADLVTQANEREEKSPSTKEKSHGTRTGLKSFFK